MFILSISSSIMFLIYIFIWRRLISHVRSDSPYRLILGIVIVFLMFATPTPFILQKYGFENYYTNILIWVGSLSLGFFSFVFSLIVVRDLTFILIGFIHKFFGWVHNIFRFDSNAVESLDVNRRRFIISATNIGILGMSGMLSGYGFFEARRSPTIVEVSIPIHNLPDDLKGFRIVQITDTHVGPTTMNGYMKTIVERVNMLEPDIVVFTGDIADGTVSCNRNQVSHLADLSTRYGSYFVTGNHEYFYGEHAWLEEVDRLGLRVLINEHQVLTCGKGRIILAGVTDYSAGRYNSNRASNPKASLSGASQCNVKILLAHQPRSIYAAAESGFDLQISGHTHGGQYYPCHFTNFSPYLAGLYKFNNTWIYVSRGTGYWGPPIRLGATSEITLIKLTTGKFVPNLA